MGDNSVERLRLSLMQDMLPVGLAMLDRFRRGEAKDLMEVLQTSDEPFEELRDEGEIFAKNFREKLDQIKPGLGNPVVPVSVEVDNSPIVEETPENESLLELLHSIESKLDTLENLLGKQGETTFPVHED